MVYIKSEFFMMSILLWTSQLHKIGEPSGFYKVGVGVLSSCQSLSI